MSRPWSLVDSPVTSRTSPSSSSFTLRWPRPRNHASTAATTAGRTVAGSTRDTSRVPRARTATALAPRGAGPSRGRVARFDVQFQQLPAELADELVELLGVGGGNGADLDGQPCHGV